MSVGATRERATAPRDRAREESTRGEQVATTCGRDLASALSGSVSAGLRRSGRSVASRVNASSRRLAWSAVPGRRPGEALLSARGGAIYLKFCMLCLSIVRSHRARVVERPLLHARLGVGLGRRGARGDDAWTRTLRMQRHLHVTRGDSRPSHGMTHFSAASFRSPQRSQTDRQILLDTQSAEGTSSSLRATHTVPPQLLHPSRRQTCCTREG